MTPPRVSVRLLLVMVATVALLIPFPWGALFFSIITFALWIFPPVFVVLMCDSLGKGRSALIATLVVVGAECYYQYLPIDSGMSPISWLTFCLTPINLTGPIHAATRRWHDRRLVSGEILWAWMGLVWMVMIVSPDFRHLHVDAISSLEMLEEFARLTTILSLFLLLYGTRPVRPNPVWPHHLGWVVAECDVIVWGWYASSWLR